MTKIFIYRMEWVNFIVFILFIYLLLFFFIFSPDFMQCIHKAGELEDAEWGEGGGN